MPRSIAIWLPMTFSEECSPLLLLRKGFLSGCFHGCSCQKTREIFAQEFPKMQFNVRPGSTSSRNVGTCPVEGFMIQPPLLAATLQPQPLSSVSWFIPKLWPSSCARVTAAPRGLSEWSSKQTQEHNV